ARKEDLLNTEETPQGGESGARRKSQDLVARTAGKKICPPTPALSKLSTSNQGSRAFPPSPAPRLLIHFAFRPSEGPSMRTLIRHPARRLVTVAFAVIATGCVHRLPD